jgi:hypothetical protein
MSEEPKPEPPILLSSDTLGDLRKQLCPMCGVAFADWPSACDWHEHKKAYRVLRRAELEKPVKEPKPPPRNAN